MYVFLFLLTKGDGLCILTHCTKGMLVWIQLSILHRLTEYLFDGNLVSGTAGTNLALAAPRIPNNAASVAYFDESGQVAFLWPPLRPIQ